MTSAGDVARHDATTRTGISASAKAFTSASPARSIRVACSLSRRASNPTPSHAAQARAGSLDDAAADRHGGTRRAQNEPVACARDDRRIERNPNGMNAAPGSTRPAADTSRAPTFEVPRMWNRTHACERRAMARRPAAPHRRATPRSRATPRPGETSTPPCDTLLAVDARRARRRRAFPEATDRPAAPCDSIERTRADLDRAGENRSRCRIASDGAAPRCAGHNGAGSPSPKTRDPAEAASDRPRSLAGTRAPAAAASASGADRRDRRRSSRNRRRFPGAPFEYAEPASNARTSSRTSASQSGSTRSLLR